MGLGIGCSCYLLITPTPPREQVLKQEGQTTASLKIVPLSDVYFPFVTRSR